MAKFIEVDSDWDEVQCSSCLVMYHLIWRNDYGVTEQEYCPFCGEEIEWED